LIGLIIILAYEVLIGLITGSKRLTQGDLKKAEQQETGSCGRCHKKAGNKEHFDEGNSKPML
jgi:cytochrome c553